MLFVWLDLLNIRAVNHKGSGLAFLALGPNRDIRSHWLVIDKAVICPTAAVILRVVKPDFIAYADS